jgi:hypothetical protein
MGMEGTTMTVEEEGKFLHIDLGNLDREWARQSRLFNRWATRLANAQLSLDTAKATAKVTGAECAKEIRKYPERFGLKRATDAAVKDEILLHPAYQKAVRVMNRKKHAAAILEAAVEALQHKKKALEDLVRLRLADYFSEPQPPKGARREMEERVAGNTFQRIGNKKRRNDV